MGYVGSWGRGLEKLYDDGAGEEGWRRGMMMGLGKRYGEEK